MRFYDRHMIGGVLVAPQRVFPQRISGLLISSVKPTMPPRSRARQQPVREPSPVASEDESIEETISQEEGDEDDEEGDLDDEEPTVESASTILPINEFLANIALRLTKNDGNSARIVNRRPKRNWQSR